MKLMATSLAPRRLSLSDPAPWMEDAFCRQYEDPDVFFPPSGDRWRAQVRAAKAVCRHCPVLTECGQYAVERVELVGIWGGMTDRERRQLRRQMPV